MADRAKEAGGRFDGRARLNPSGDDGWVAPVSDVKLASVRERGDADLVGTARNADAGDRMAAPSRFRTNMIGISSPAWQSVSAIFADSPSTNLP